MASPRDTRLPFARRLLPSIVDEYARYEPEKVLYSFPVSSDVKTWHHVTYSELARAVDILAWFIEGRVGRSENFETIAYIGGNDVRYAVFFLAAMKCGYVILTPSPRNSTEGQVSLLAETACLKFCYTVEMSQKVNDIKAAVGESLKLVLLPTYAEIIASPNASKSYPFSKSYDDLEQKPAFIFHTSGTTGLPKPISLSHAYLAVMDNMRNLPTPEGRIKGDWTIMKYGDTLLNAFPLFHNAGAAMGFYDPIFYGTAVCMLPSDVPLNEVTFLRIVENIKLTAACLPPSFIEDISKSPEAFKQLSKLKYLFYGGGPLSYGAGDKLNKATHIIPMLGGTEMGLVSSLIAKDWKFFEWNPYYGVDLDQIGDSDLYELVIRKKPESTQFHGVFQTFPDITEWRTRDIFSRDIEDPNCWLFAGRTDDVIVLGNGEKFNPVSMEAHIVGDPLVVGALVVGQGKFQVALIIEPDYAKWDATRHPQDLIDEVWSTVQEANSFSAAVGRVFKSKIIVARKEKPLKRTGKGTVLRPATIAEYEAEIHALYSNSEKESARPLPDIITVLSMTEFVTDCLAEYLSGLKIGIEDDLFAAGLDSLQTLGLANLLRAAVEPRLKDKFEAYDTLVSQRSIYENPSIHKLAMWLDDLFNTKKVTVSTRESKIDGLVEKYTTGIPEPTEPLKPGKKEDINVILTGTTGSLGSYILHLLILSPIVSKIYCFNRTSDALERTQKSFIEKGFQHSLPDLPKVEFLHTKLDQPDFGLGETKFTELVQHIDAIIHNAWTVNFNQSVSSFENPHIKSIRTLTDFSILTPNHAHIFFISSIGAVANWAATQPTSHTRPSVPELHFTDPRTPLPQGYSESKHIAERILTSASTLARIPTSIARVGQIAGPSTISGGKWNDAEWLPSLIKTSKTLGLLPNSLGSMDDAGIDWVPIDAMAAAVLELLHYRLSNQNEVASEVFHLVNPQRSTWSSLLPAVMTYFKAQNVTLEAVPYEDWVGALEKKVAAGPVAVEEMEAMPVLKFLEFFQGLRRTTDGMAVLETRETVGKSKVLAGLEAVGVGIMGMWLEQWGY